MQALIKEVKKTMKRYGAKHAIYGIKKWNGELELIEQAADANYYATDRTFEEEASFLRNCRKAQMIYALHAQD